MLIVNSDLEFQMIVVKIRNISTCWWLPHLPTQHAGKTLDGQINVLQYRKRVHAQHEFHSEAKAPLGKTRVVANHTHENFEAIINSHCFRAISLLSAIFGFPVEGFKTRGLK